MLTYKSFLAGAATLGMVTAMAVAGSAAAQVRGSAAVDATARAGVDTSIADRRLERELDGAVHESRRDDSRGRDGGSVRGNDATRGDSYTETQRRYTERYRRDDRGRDYGRDRDYRRDRDRYDRDYGYDRDYRARGGVRYSGGRDWNRRYRDGASFSLGVDLGDVTIGYRSGFRDGYYVYYDGRHRYRHRNYQRGYARHYDCHPVHYSEWFRGRRVPVAATMCYDRYGYGYIVPGSERRDYYW